MPICWRRSSCAVALWLKVCGWLGVTTGHHGQVAPLGASLPLLHCGGIVPSCSHPGCFLHVPVLAPACRGVMWWPQARGGLGQALAEPMTVSIRKQSMDGCSPSCARGSPSSAGLNVTLQNAFTATVGANNAARCCPVTSTRQGVPGSGIIPEMGSMQGVHALTGLIRPVKAPPANRGQGETRWQKV